DITPAAVQRLDTLRAEIPALRTTHPTLDRISLREGGGFYAVSPELDTDGKADDLLGDEDWRVVDALPDWWPRWAEEVRTSAEYLDVWEHGVCFTANEHYGNDLMEAVTLWADDLRTILATF